jgi:large subunit ribosomal protein L5
VRALQQARARRTAPFERRHVGTPVSPLQRYLGDCLTMPARLRERYRAEVAPALMRELGYSNLMAVPRLEKIVLNMGVGEAVQNPKVIESAVEELTAIAGQKPVVTRAKKAISNFKLREGMPIGAMVTLRGERMYEFLDRLVSVALPRVRDFKGVPDRSFDGRGNYSLGLREQVIFPEINLDKVDKIKGLTIVICTTARTDAEGKALLRGLGIPFRV